MKIKILLLIIASIILIPLSLSAQTGAPVFSPFVSQMDAEVKNNLVRLSWRDSPDVRGSIYIYRSVTPFVVGAPLPQGRVEIPYGTQFYIDELESGGTFYYFAIASDVSGQIYEVPIANTNLVSITVEEANPYSVPIVTAPPPAPPPSPPTDASPLIEASPSAPELSEAEPQQEESIPEIVPPVTGISMLSAEQQGDRIIISFTRGNVENATLYRSTRPISHTYDLLGAVIIQRRIDSPFNDSPVPGIPYYYAVIAEEDLIRGMVEIVPGRNATQNPVETRLASAPESRDLQSIPLPQISVSSVLEDIPSDPQADSSLKRPRVFARDLQTAPVDSEDYALSLIVKGAFWVKNWEASREELTRFLALPRSPDATARAKFYLGQCYYFQLQPEEGIFEFLGIRDRYPAEAREWLDASLEMMRN